jgi:hypothetical protein
MHASVSLPALTLNLSALQPCRPLTNSLKALALIVLLLQVPWASLELEKKSKFLVYGRDWTNHGAAVLACHAVCLHRRVGVSVPLSAPLQSPVSGVQVLGTASRLFLHAIFGTQ